MSYARSSEGTYVPEWVYEVTLPNGEVLHRSSDTEAYGLIKQHGGGGVRMVKNPV